MAGRLLPYGLVSSAAGSLVPPAKQTSVGVVVATIQNVPKWLQAHDHESAMFFETIRRRAASATSDEFGTVKRAEPQIDSVATTVGDLVDDFNDLLSKLRTAGVLEQ